MFIIIKKNNNKILSVIITSVNFEINILAIYIFMYCMSYFFL